MASIGLFFGSDTGTTEDVAMRLQEKWGSDEIVLKDISESKAEDLLEYQNIIVGSSTWNDGELVSGWYDVYDDLDNLDLSGKTIAIFGVGDQDSYSSWFCDAIGILGTKFKERGAQLIGRWPTEGYEFDSTEYIEDNHFMGLAIDETNQDELTEGRLDKWIDQIKSEF